MDERYWVIVASYDHVQKGKSEGFAQACHGKPGPLRRMRRGDGVIFYSSKMKFQQSELCQKFTALGTVRDDEVFQFKMSDNFVPFRRRIDFIDCDEVPIRPLIERLCFIKRKSHWGTAFRYGFIEIPREDFELISTEMGAVA
ncbi:MAG: EVE domain-containing protein [Gammaproteobacteria bacterium]